MSNQHKNEPMMSTKLDRKEDQRATRALLAEYDSDSAEISPDEHARNLAILQALSVTGINPLLANEPRSEKVDPDVKAVFDEETERTEGSYSHAARVAMQYDGFVDVDAWTKPDNE